MWSFMKYRKYRSRHNSLESVIRREHLSIKKHSSRKDEILIQDTTTLRQWGGLRKCWKGYKIAKGEADKKKIEFYVKAIRKFRQELKTPVLEFPQFGLLGRKMPQEFYCPESSSCAQTQNGLEDYRLQELADPFRIER